MLSLTTLVASSVLATTPVPASLPNSPGTAPVVIATNTAQPSIEQTLERRYICKGCNDNENRTLAFFQDEGIRDKKALATIMGNIRQESTFVPNICEGGARTTYQGCRSGGYGLIQFTSSDRYFGLGHFARRTGGDPSSLDTQLRYITTERQWAEIEGGLKTPGKTIERYMSYAYRWLGWGIHGARTNYAYDYYKRLVPLESPPADTEVSAVN